MEMHHNNYGLVQHSFKKAENKALRSSLGI